jgi:hypothetical protein
MVGVKDSLCVSPNKVANFIPMRGHKKDESQRKARFLLRTEDQAPFWAHISCLVLVVKHCLLVSHTAARLAWAAFWTGRESPALQHFLSDTSVQLEHLPHIKGGWHLPPVSMTFSSY